MSPEVMQIEKPPLQAVSLGELARVFGQIALMSFGGPAGQIALMHRVLVDEKKWVSERSFLHALNFCMLLPGPEAQQLATYIGWLMHGVTGGVIAGGLFILPGVAAIMALSILYATWGNVGFVAGAFFGLKAAVLAVVAQAILRVGKRALKTNAARAIAVSAFVALFFFNAPFPLIVFGAGVLGYIGARAEYRAFTAGFGHGEADDSVDAKEEAIAGRAPQAMRAALMCLVLWLAPVALLVAIAGADNVYAQIAVFFSKMAVVTFGGAYAVLAYVAQQAVDNYGWLTASEMLNGLGMAETTPGPLIMVLQFVGFMAAFRAPGAAPPLAAGALGGLLASYVTFMPCFLWIFFGAPYIEKLRHNKALSGALTAITAAVVGVIANLALWFAIHALFRETFAVAGYGCSFSAPVLASIDFWSLILSVGALLAVFRFHAGMSVTLAGSCLAGAALYLTGAM